MLNSSILLVVRFRMQDTWARGLLRSQPGATITLGVLFADSSHDWREVIWRSFLVVPSGMYFSRGLLWLGRSRKRFASLGMNGWRSATLKMICFDGKCSLGDRSSFTPEG